MVAAKSRFLTCAGRTIHVLTWGAPAARAVMIWHGVTGCSRDHESLAMRLAGAGYYVVAPDAPCCGLSDWARDKDHDSSLSFYAEVAAALLEQLAITRAIWIGASKGGGLGIMMAARNTPATISHLILNDVGPELPERFRASLSRMLLTPPSFPSFLEFEDFLRKSLGRGGLVLSDDGWRRLAISWMRRKENGDFTYHYDPALGTQFLHHPEDFDLWNHWDKVKAKTLLMRGAQSIVTDAELSGMIERGPRCVVLERDGGHITMLDDPAEQDAIIAFIQD